MHKSNEETISQNIKGIDVSIGIINEVKKAVLGKDEIIRKILLAILAKGHVLLEDIPGVGKTTLAIAFSKATGLNYNRIQFTPDVMPSDITGFTIYKKASETFEFSSGAVMCNLLLADEINRTSSKTQSALLQVMEEGIVTVDLKTYEVPKPFTVIATQNPFGSAGTQLLPESQLDRFLMRLSIGYPDSQSEMTILKSRANAEPLQAILPVVDADQLIEIQNIAERTYMSDELYSYIVTLVSKTRKHELIDLGVSPRGTLALASISRALAFLNNRDYVLPIDVQSSFFDVCAHRIILTQKAKMSNVSIEKLFSDIIRSTAAPQIQ